MGWGSLQVVELREVVEGGGGGVVVGARYGQGVRERKRGRLKTTHSRVTEGG